VGHEAFHAVHFGNGPEIAAEIIVLNVKFHKPRHPRQKARQSPHQRILPKPKHLQLLQCHNPARYNTYPILRQIQFLQSIPPGYIIRYFLYTIIVKVNHVEVGHFEEEGIDLAQTIVCEA